jgi:hypothetical protein
MTVVMAIPVLFAAPTGRGEGRCSDVSLHGSYAYSANGFVTQTPSQPPFTPIAEAGTYTFDGSGSFSTTNTLSVGGQIIPRTATGTYTADADCTGSATISGGVSFNFAIARAARPIRFIVSTAGVAVTGTMEKQYITLVDRH